MRTMLFTAAHYAEDGVGRITSRLGVSAEALLYRDQDDLFAIIAKAHGESALSCVFVDEAQFLTKEQVWQLARVVDRPHLAGGCSYIQAGIAEPGVIRHIALDRLIYSHVRVGRVARGTVLDSTRFTLLTNAAGKPDRVRVRRGTRFAAGEVLGSVNGMAHVHLTVGPSGYELNPLRLGFKGFSDRHAPRIAAVEFYDAAGKRLPYRAGQRMQLPLADWQLVVDAWDQVDNNLPRRRLGLYSLGYQWLRSDGQPVAGWVPPPLAIEFERLSSDPEAARQTYADRSGVSVQSRAATQFRYLLSPAPVAGAPLPPGDYTLRLVARDHAGNQALQGRDLAISLR
jgi:hypothetical protein